MALNHCLSIHFIWHPSDEDRVSPVLAAIRKCFARDSDRPFSRGLDVPLFFYSSNEINSSPSDVPAALAQKNVTFIFTSTNTIGRESWKEYIEHLPSNDSQIIVPVAIDRPGLNHKGTLDGKNCLRHYDWPSALAAEYAVIFLAHEIYRHGFSEHLSSPGKESSIKIFLSHAKAGNTGRKFSEQLKQFIDGTNMNRFFDSTEISAGFNFDNEIEEHLTNSTLIAFETDAYSSRYWCQREILSAKIKNIPIVVVNCLEHYEDRIFPAASNVPCIHASGNEDLTTEDLLSILSEALLETIRHKYIHNTLNLYKSQNWIPNDSEISSRPPEIRQILDIIDNGKTNICYPEPPIYAEESDWLERLGITAYTPLWSPDESESLADLRIGLSLSNPENDGFSTFHLHDESIYRLSQDLARHFLSRSAILLYGGDLRKDGFTQFILEEAMILQNRLKKVTPRVENHLAWPLHVSDKEITDWRAQYSDVMKTVCHVIPEDITDVDAATFLPPTTTENSYIWSRTLTTMRIDSISSSDARVCAGGRLTGYKGKMPGVLEEIQITLDQGKPIYLLGGFGGVTSVVCNSILNNKIETTLTENWQMQNNNGYTDLLGLMPKEHKPDYQRLANTLTAISIQDLASNAGLSLEEYTQLMKTVFRDECVHLILKGLKKRKE